MSSSHQAAADALLLLKDVSVNIDGKTIIDNINLSIEANEIVSLIGPNGAGKSTLVRVILGLTKASRGSIVKQAGLRIGYMPQHIHIETTLPLNVNRFLNIANRSKPARIAQVLTQVSAAELAQRPVQSLSGGELQRILLARSLLREPQLLVLDEPAQGVDINGQAELYQLIRELRDEYQCGVLMVSHDLHLVMAATDKVICMNHHICCSGHPEQVSNDPAYQELFGMEKADALAIYAHHHDHRHDDEGNVIQNDNHDGRHHG